MIVLFRLAAFYFCRLPEFKAYFVVAAAVWACSAIYFLAVFGSVLSAWWHARSQRGKVDAKEQREKTTHPRTILAGVAAGLSMNFVMLVTFGVLGFGWNGSGILLQSRTQSSKLISVWTEVEPVSLVVSRPAPMIGGIIFFGIVHAYVYRWLSAAWPKGAVNRGIRFSGLVFVMTFLFWEFITAFNLFGEPLHLMALELAFWALIALADGMSIGAIMEGRASDNATDAEGQDQKCALPATTGHGERSMETNDSQPLGDNGISQIT